MDLFALQKTLEESGAPWRAKRTPILDRHPRKVGGIPEIDVREVLQAASGKLLPPRSSRATIVPSVDWRMHQPPIIGAAKDQSACMSCAAFAVCAAIETRLHMLEAGNGPGVDLSEADLFFCGGGDCSQGMLLDAALSRAQKHGVGLEADFGYDPAASNCVAIRPFARLSSFHYIVNDNDRRISISEDGPVVAVMRIFTDFLAYDAGIYEHVSGTDEGLHAVLIVGYDDRERFWIARNSWGPDAGEGGYFRIRYGQCEIDMRPFIAVDPERIR